MCLALRADPIALFCDRAVDALLSDRTVKIPQDDKRSSAALKYLFTELIANKCGGARRRRAATASARATSNK